MEKKNCSPNITIKCAVLTGAVLQRPCSFRVCVHDLFRHIVFEGITDKNGEARFSVKKNTEYRVSVYATNELSPRAIHRWIKSSCKGNGRLYFMFIPKIMCHPALRVICLTDKNYVGLPILKGEIKLWRDPMR